MNTLQALNNLSSSRVLDVATGNGNLVSVLIENLRDQVFYKYADLEKDRNYSAIEIAAPGVPPTVRLRGLNARPRTL